MLDDRVVCVEIRDGREKGSESKLVLRIKGRDVGKHAQDHVHVNRGGPDAVQEDFDSTRGDAVHHGSVDGRYGPDNGIVKMTENFVCTVA